MRRSPGFAMVGALLALLLAGLFGATMAALGRTELLLARNGTRFALALVALDECAAAATRGLPLGWRFDDVLAGPDGVPGSADDGAVAAPPPCIVTATPLAGAPPRIHLDLATARGGGRRAGRAVIGRRARPGPGALLWLPSADRAGVVPGRLVLDGGIPGPRPTAAIATPDEPVVADAWLAAHAVEVTASTGAPTWSPAPPIAAVIDAARAVGGAPPAAALAPTAPAPALLGLAEGDLIVTDARWASGLLVVTGRVRVMAGGALTLDGLLVTAGGVDVAAGGAGEVRGALWSGAPAWGALDVGGTLRVAWDPAALTAAATMLTLPHEPLLLGWLDR